MTSIVSSHESNDMDVTPTVPSPLPSSAVQRSSALSNRLTNVLSASYADSGIRDSLETLDLRKTRNIPETRRQLRLDVQKEVIDCNGEIVQDFGKVAEQLKRIGSVISSLNQTCEEMRKHITLARQETNPVLDEATTLIEQRIENETKQRLLNAFTKHFIISDEDLVALASSVEPVDSHFFAVLSRVKQVHSDCQVLLGGENQRLGLEIMEQSSKHLSSGYQKLYKWIQKEFKSLNLEDPQMNSSMRHALHVLAERPTMFHSCLDFFAEAREYILSDAFHYALTDAISGPGAERNVKPIEFSAHDPLRYIGDMLAWVHSAAVSEREALEALFVSEGDELARGIKIGIRSEPWSRIDGEESVFDGHKALNDLVNRDLRGVSRALHQRIELVMQGHEDPVTTYKVVNLLSFYRMTFSKLVGQDCILVDVINSLERFTFGHLETLMQDSVNVLSADLPNLSPPPDLSAPQYLIEALEVLASLMKAFDASVATREDDSSLGPENKFTPVLRSALDPFLDLIRSSFKELADNTSVVIYHTNVLLAVRSIISPFSFACATHLAPVSTALSSLRMDLLEIQHRFLLEASGLQDLLVALSPLQKDQESPVTKQTASNLAEIANLPEFQPVALSYASQQLDDFLPSALMDATDNLKSVRNPSLVKSVTEEAVEVFCRDFEFVEGMIIGADEARGRSHVSLGSDIASTSSISGHVGDDDGGDNGDGQYSLRALFPRTVGEIQVLLS
ncbi:Conserved oligomeric Golgi complex subunit 6 [Elaphomyces granulatus]